MFGTYSVIFEIFALIILLLLFYRIGYNKGRSDFIKVWSYENERLRVEVLKLRQAIRKQAE